MGKLLYLLGCISLFSTGTAQTARKDSLSSKDTTVYKNVLLVNFEPKMYLSDIDRDVTQASDLAFRDLLALYQHQLVSATTKVFNSLNYKVFSPRSKGENDTIDDHLVTYHSIGYHYEPVPEAKETPTASTKKKKEEPKEPAEGIINGQIVESGNKVPHYMAAVVSNKKGFEYLIKRYNAEYIVVLTQFETKRDFGGFSPTDHEEENRLLKVHYTVFNGTGERVCSNVAENKFPTQQNKAADIIKENFPVIAGKIVRCLPQAPVINNKQQPNH